MHGEKETDSKSGRYSHHERETNIFILKTSDVRNDVAIAEKLLEKRNWSK